MRSFPIRGQTIVLGCVNLFAIALMTMASYSLANAIHQKISLQSHADAQAYSLATVEARGLNVAAHYNRALVASFVAQMSTHAWMAIASSDVNQLAAGKAIMIEVMAFEALLGCSFPPPRVQHCPCVWAAFRAWRRFRNQERNWANTLKGLEQEFNDGVAQLKRMSDSISTQQNIMLGTTMALTSSAGTVVSSLGQKNAPGSGTSAAVIALNAPQFACALEGSTMDNACLGPASRPKASAATRSNVIMHAANADRPSLDNGAALVALVSTNFNVAGTVPQNAAGEGRWVIDPLAPPWTNNSFVSNNGYSAGQGDQAKAAGAKVPTAIASLIGFRHTPITAWGFSGAIRSDANGGNHSPGNTHSGNHREFVGVVQNDPCGNSNCFINYRAEASEAKDFGQPTVYGGATFDLRKYQTKNDTTGVNYADAPPWELNTNRKVNVDLVNNDTATVDYTARNNGQGYALAKAKVYFHQLGDWTVPPNLFDPFWRAKLHFMSRAEISVLLPLVGDANGLRMLAPVEGELQ